MLETTPETILNTPVEDLRITGEHPIPEWLTCEVNPSNDHRIDAFLCVVAIVEVDSGNQESEARDEQ